MPVVPAPKTLPGVQQAYNVQSVSNGAGFARLGQGISDLGQGIEKVQKEKADKNANDAITQSMSDRTQAETSYKLKLAASKSQADVDKANEEFEKDIEKSNARVSSKIVDKDVNERWKQWADRDVIDRKSRVTDTSTKRSKEIDIDSTNKQVDLSAVTYQKSPSQETFDAFHNSIDAHIKSTNMLPGDAALYRKTQEQQLHNQTWQHLFNGQDYRKAREYLHEHQDDFDKETWKQFNDRTNNTIIQKEGEATGRTIALSAESTDVEGHVYTDYNVVKRELDKVPEAIRKQAKATAEEHINEAERRREENSKQVFVTTLPLVETGQMDPSKFGPSMISSLTKQAYETLKDARKRYVNGVQSVALEAQKNIQDAQSGTASRVLHNFIDSLNEEDAKSATSLLYLKLNESVAGVGNLKNSLTKTDLEALESHAKARSVGETTVQLGDLYREVSIKIPGHPNLHNDSEEQKKFSKDNPDFLAFIYKRTRGVSKENMPKVLDDTIDLWYSKTRSGSTVGEFFKTKRDQIDIKRIELDLSRDQVDSELKRRGLNDVMKNQTEATKTRVVTQLQFMDNGYISRYKVDPRTGQTKLIEPTDLLFGAESVREDDVGTKEVQYENQDPVDFNEMQNPRSER